MIKWKILLAVALYITLGLIAYFNLGFHHMLTDRLGERSTLNQPAWEKLKENITSSQSETLQKFQDPSSDQEE